MDDTEFTVLQRRVLRTKKDLRSWEEVFAKKHGRPPTIKDISERPNVEKFYKKYNALKRELKRETEARQMEEVSSQAASLCSLPDLTNTQESASSRRGSVEFIKSPSRSSSKTSQVFQHDSRPSRLSIHKLSEIEDMKIALKPSSSTSTATSNGTERVLTEDEAFWLGLTPTSTASSSPTSASQPLPSIMREDVSSPSSVSSTQPPPRLILGGSQPRKRREAKKKSYNPFQRRQMLSQQIQEQLLEEQKASVPKLSSSQQTKDTMDISDDDGDDMEGVEVVNHEENPFRNYDPSLFHWEDPTFSVGPGFFASSKAYSSYMVPIIKEESRRDRILRKIEKGTLGEVLEENRLLEEELDRQVREFGASNNIVLNPDSLQGSIQPIDEELLNTPDYVQKKRRIKRQTKLFKMKFVET